MRRNILFNIVVLILMPTLFASCLGSGNDDDLSITNPSIAPFVYLTFTKSDSVENLETAKFVLQYQQPEQLTVDGVSVNIDSLIVNLDSLPHGTRIDTVVANFLFGQYPHAVYAIYTDNFERKLLEGDGKDTLNFTRPMIVQVISYDEQHKFYFRIKVNVHTVVPYEYQWTFMTEFSDAAEKQKAIYGNDCVYYFLGDRIHFRKDDGLWQSVENQLPADADINNILTFSSGFLYLFHDNKIYTSFDEQFPSWSSIPFPISGYETVSLLMVYKDKLWGIIRNGNDYYSAFSADGYNWQTGALLPEDFPVRQYAAVPNSQQTGNPKAFVYGGITKEGVESAKAFSSEDGLRWISFKPLKTFPLLSTGMSIVKYDNKLMMFGGDCDSTFVQVSGDEGFSWDKADSTAIKLPHGFKLRTWQSTFVDNQNRIVIAGGRETTAIAAPLSDIWTMKLNSIDWGK
ncbi:MAG: DUF6242 domain-containing protein [Prevotellaceae bacterium]|jgi:hypothetical protein|nr:DUF6242 domain-containing protein [Prevotellaceae bacterium]